MSVLTELPTLLKSGIRRHRVPGAVVGIYRKGRVTQAAAGKLNLDTRVPATADSVFQIGSITKVFTATLIMQLVDEGQIDIDQPLGSYLRNFAVADGIASQTVTVRQLLCHSSGIDGDFFVNSGRGDDTIARLQDMGRMLPQLFAPGERMSYCNFGFAMLGRVIEVVTGDTFDAAMRKRLFNPLGMNQAMTRPEDALKFRCAIGHVPAPQKKGSRARRQPQTEIVSPLPWLSFGQKAAGSTPSMSVGDLLQFVHMHLNGGRTRSGRQLLSRRSLREMQRYQLHLPKNSPRGNDGWGLGWMLSRWSGKRVIGHDGATVGQYAFLRVLPEQNLAVALLTNGGDAGGLYDEIFNAAFARLGRVEMPTISQPDAPVNVPSERVVGCYENMTGQVCIEPAASGYQIVARRSPGTIAGTELPTTPVSFIDRNTARLAGSDPVLNRTTITFEGANALRPEFLGLGSRLYRRVEP